MKNYGYVRISAATPIVKIGSVEENCARIKELIERAAQQKAQFVVLPELSLTGYTCGDLFRQRQLLASCEKQLQKLIQSCADIDIVAVVGVPLQSCGRLFNCAVTFHRGEILGITAKGRLSCGQERWFSTPDLGEGLYLFGERYESVNTLRFGQTTIGIEIGECSYTPSADIVVTLAATCEEVGKYDYLRDLIRIRSAHQYCACVYTSAGFGESSTDEVFGGNIFVAENGVIMGQSERWATSSQIITTDIDTELLAYVRMTSATKGCSTQVKSNALPPYTAQRPLRPILRHPFLPQCDRQTGEVFAIQRAGLMQRLSSCGIKRCVIGISGGLDSTLALLVTVEAFDRLNLCRKDIVGITMPGFGTTSRTHTNAIALMRALGISIEEISIRKACEQHFEDIGLPEGDHSVTFENAQARERTQILMDYANRIGAIVIGTGDMSELALGWATYNGDHMSMYGVNAGVSKTLVQQLTRWYANQCGDKMVAATLRDVVDTPISPELLPANDNGEIAQQTEDLVGPYELHDFFLYNMLGYGFAPDKIYMLACVAFEGTFDEATIKHWLKTFTRRFFGQQFKRSAMPDGVRVCPISLSPRGAWVMPSDACASTWLQAIDEL